MTKSEVRFSALIGWRERNHFPRGATVSDLADSFSCERLRDKDIPKSFRADVTAFRHLTQKARQAAVRAYYGRPDSMWKTPPRKRLRKKQAVYAVCGYQAKRCTSVKEADLWIEDRLSRTSYPSAFIVKGELIVIEKVTEWPLKRTVLK